VTSHWELRDFRVEFPRWRDKSEPTPPGDRIERVDRWWRGLEFSAGRPSAVLVSPDQSPEGNLWWTWIPGADFEDADGRPFRVACYFWIFEREDPRQIRCKCFQTYEAIRPH
jgi:hypothetical protein